MRTRQIYKVLGFGLCLAANVAHAEGAPQGTLDGVGMKALDVVAMIDCSPSTKGTDPLNERGHALQFLIDYLSATSEAFNLSHRIAFANFGGSVHSVLPLTLIQTGSIIEPPSAEQIPFTDFRPPLEFALRQLAHASGAERGKVAVLFTDGRPALSGSSNSDRNLNDEELNKYFNGEHLPTDLIPLSLPDLVTRLRQMKVDVYVITVGSDRPSAQAWRRLLSQEDHYIELTSPRELALAYHRIIASAVGFAEFEKKRMEANEDWLLPSAQLTGTVTLTVLKDNPNVSISVLDSSDHLLHARRGSAGTGRLFEVYNLGNDPTARGWRVHVTGGGALLLVDMQPLGVSIPPYVGGSGHAVEMLAQTERDGIVFSLPGLRLVGSLRGSSLPKEQRYPFTHLGGGRYGLIMQDIQGRPGEYLLQIEGFLHGKKVPLLSPTVPVTLLEFPSIKNINVEPEGSGFRVQVVLHSNGRSLRRILVAAKGTNGETLAEASLVASQKSQSEFRGSIGGFNSTSLQDFEIRIEGVDSPRLAFESRFVVPSKPILLSTQQKLFPVATTILLLIVVLVTGYCFGSRHTLLRSTARALSTFGLDRPKYAESYVLSRLSDYAHTEEYDNAALIVVAKRALLAAEREGREAWARMISKLRHSPRPEFRRVAEQAMNAGFGPSRDIMEDEAQLSQAGAYSYNMETDL